MKKIAIVSEFQINTVNYGNHLQAYALKKYLNDKFPSMHIDSLQVVPFAKKKQTFLIYNIYCRFIDLYTYMNNYEKDSLEKCRVEKRYKRFHDFALNYNVDVNDIKPWSVLKK